MAKIQLKRSKTTQNKQKYRKIPKKSCRRKYEKRRSFFTRGSGAAPRPRWRGRGARPRPRRNRSRDASRQRRRRGGGKRRGGPPSGALVQGFRAGRLPGGPPLIGPAGAHRRKPGSYPRDVRAHRGAGGHWTGGLSHVGQDHRECTAQGRADALGGACVHRRRGRVRRGISPPARRARGGCAQAW